MKVDLISRNTCLRLSVRNPRNVAIIIWFALMLSGCTGRLVGQLDMRVQACLRRLESTQDVSAQEMIIVSLTSAANRQANLVALFEGWGKRSRQYDLAIVRMLSQPHRPSTYELDEEMFELMCARIKENPSLLKQFFWYHRWMDGSNLSRMRQEDLELVESAEQNAEPLFVRIRRNLLERHLTPTEKRYYLILMASMLDRPEDLFSVDVVNLDRHWADRLDWLATQGPFLVFDTDAGVYRLDSDAFKSMCPVNAAKQRWSHPSEPIP